MKVQVTQNSKQVITLAEAPIARQIIMDLKEDGGLEDYIRSAISAAYAATCERCDKIYESSAEITKNHRAQDVFVENSKDLDVWIDAIAKVTYGFCEIGFYLSDIWQLSNDNREDVVSHMFVRKYARTNT